MTVCDFKKLLKAKNMNIHQLDDENTLRLEKANKLFGVSLKEAAFYWWNYFTFKRQQSKKLKKFDRAYEDFTQDIDLLILDPEKYIELDNNNTAMEALINLWTDEDKNAFNNLHDEYMRLWVKNGIGFQVSAVLLRNWYIQRILQGAIFSISFFLSYQIEEILDLVFPIKNPLINRFFHTLFLFVTLDAALELLKNCLLHWRVLKLQKSWLALSPLVEQAEAMLSKLNKQ